LVFPEFGVDVLQAAELPMVPDEDVDAEPLLGGGGLAFLVVEAGEGLEIGGIFAADDVGLSVDAGFQGIHGRSGLALSGAGAGGVPGVEAVGLDLAER
jgi:hypothetical protein